MKPPLLTIFAWKCCGLLAIILGTFIWISSLAPIPQDVSYHGFADTRSFAGIPNFFDVLSNVAFLLVGILGVRFCLNHRSGKAHYAWLVFFTGIAIVSIGSAYYHWRPTNATLVWDRLPMTIGFMGLFVALIGEHVHEKLVTKLLAPAVLIGIATVFYWQWTDDLRFYAWVQFMPLITLPLILFWFKNGYSHQWLLLIALGWYLLAKIAEIYDAVIFESMQNLISGHTIKHLLAAIGCYCILLMLEKRKQKISA